MAWYLVVLNCVSAAIVLGAIVGSHLWAIAAQDQGLLASRRETAKLRASRELVLEPAIS